MPERQSQKHSITLKGHSTSVTLEKAFWESLKEIAVAKKTSVNQLITDIDTGAPGNLSGALRVFILQYYKNAR